MPVTKLNGKQKEQIVEMLREQKSYDEISSRFGVAHGTVSYYASKAGLVRHNSRNRQRIKPIVFRAEQNGDALVELFSGLSQENKVAALRAVIEGGK